MRLRLRADKPDEIRQSVLEIATDWLAVGIDPQRSAMFIQSEVPAIDELTFFFAMLLPFNRVMRNPTLKDEIRDKGLGDNYSFGFPMYAVGQVADILTFRPAVVPVGEDQVPHLELAREVARRFNQMYCGVDPQTEDKDYLKAGGLMPIIEPKLGRVKRLVGTGGPGPSGELQKMSKSLNNAIFLSDDADVVSKKVMGMLSTPPTPELLSGATDPGTVEEQSPVGVSRGLQHRSELGQGAAGRLPAGEGRRRGDQAEAGGGAQHAAGADPHPAETL